MKGKKDFSGHELSISLSVPVKDLDAVCLNKMVTKKDEIKTEQVVPEDGLSK